MDGIFYTLQDFSFYTESITYLLIVPALVGITAFWIFLVEKDED
jgi:hypothetical protein